ncbi:hypothetical protein NA56DRAFT_615695 [Hyaloscypha hepaticicola]|uniref:G-protein coupled receptors family 1 profile domain-containing protein n=1 Tax=Hyaloscypha hepaticicola TaxID=2082293 RepID=A0A2J6QNA5_9HELO|nr:hypothetical protein NA56DRAFT_615695 [Hyaloscypha hepaticicola]
MGFVPRDYKDVPLKETKAATVVSILITLAAMGALSVCLSRRVQNVRDWSKLPLVCWLVLLIYVDSISFVASTAVLANGFGIDSSHSVCQKALLLCLSCYMTTKVLIYYFLVERVYIIRRSAKPRLKDKLYLFNSFGMLLPYCVVMALNIYFRFAVYEKGTCLIGMKKVAMIPLIGFDILVNVYLTSLFLIPLRALYSYQNDRSSQVRTIALRTFIGSCCTLTSSVVNLTVLMVLDGEPGWICLMCCNVDIFFSVLVLHWITSKDNASTMASSSQINETDEPLRTIKNSSCKRLVPRPPLSELAAYELGLREWQKLTGVTTVVTAKEPEHETEVDRISSIPPEGAITVETAHVREVYRVKPDRTWSRTVLDEEQRGKNGSTDDLCGKNDS